MASRSVIEVLKAIATLDVTGWMASAAKISQSSHQMRADWAKAAKDVNTAVNRISMAVAGMVAGTVAVGFKFNAMAQQAEIAFTTMMGDSVKARKHLKDLFDFAAKTPFTAEGVIDASRKLQAMGIAADDVLPTLRILSDAVSGLGGGTPMLDRVVRAIGQMKARAKVSAEEMMQLAENGIPAWELLAKKMGISIAEAMDLSKKGAISAEVGISAILAGLDEKFGGMSAKQATTFNGMLSTLGDMARMGAGQITKPLFDAVTQWTTRLLEEGQGGAFQTFIDSMRTQVQTFVVELRQRLPALLAEIREMAPAWLAAAQGFGMFIKNVLLFMAEHPRLLAALIALKITGILGVNQALLSLVKALMSTAAWLFNVTQAGTKAAAGLRAIGIALATISAPAIVALNIAFLAIVAVVGRWYQALQDVNRALEQGQRITDKMIALDEKRHRRRMEQLQEMQGAERKTALESDIGMAQKNIAGKKLGVESAQADLDRLNFLHRGTGEITAAKQKLAENLQALTDAERRLEDMQILLEQTTKDLAGPGAKGGGAVPGVGPGGVIPGVPGQEAPQTHEQAVQARIDELKQQAEKDRVNKEAEMALGPVGPQKPENFDESWTKVNALKTELQEMANAGELSKEKLDELNYGLEVIGTDAANGAATMDQLAYALKRTKEEADAAALAAKREAEEKRIAALIKGDFKGAGLDFEKMVQERIAAMQLAKFNEAVEKAAKSALGLSDSTDKASKSINHAMPSNGPGQNGGGFGGMGGGMSGLDAMASMGKIFEAAGTLASFLRSQQGMMATLSMQLQMARQTLALAKRSGFSPDRIKYWENMVNSLIQQMHDLVNAPQLFQAFNPDTGAPVDPLLEEARKRDPHRVGAVNLSFPNITRISQADGELLYRAVKDAGRRLGDQSDFIRKTGV